MSPGDHDPIDVRIAGAARWDDRELAADPVLAAVLDDLGRATAASVRPRGFWRLRLGRSPLMLVAAVATALILCGTTLLVRTGVEPGVERPAGPAEASRPTASRSASVAPTDPIGSPSPRSFVFPPGASPMDLRSPQSVARINFMGSVFPLPPGGNWGYYLKRAGKGPSGRVPATDVVRTLHRLAVCQWELYWLDRSAHHDEAGTTAAWRGVQQVAVLWLISGTRGSPGSFRVKDVYGAPSQDPGLIGHDVQANCQPRMWPAGAAQ